MNKDQRDQEILDRLQVAIAQRNCLDQEITDLLAEARSSFPPIPLSLLARATGLTEAGVSVRANRARKSRGY